jgi:single-stranded-DNA-specific exonuclease
MCAGKTEFGLSICVFPFFFIRYADPAGDFMEHRWSCTPPSDPGIIKKLVDELSIPDVMAQVLLNRGIDTFEKARTFFRPSVDLLHDPFLMDGMEKAVGRVLKGLETHERILVYGDYDVDGTNSVSMMYLFLKEIGADVDTYIPGRVTDGYGISKGGIDRAKDQNITLMISIDCGITAVEQVEYAREAGIDVIICDHHEPGPIIPDAFAVLDPIKPGCSYPFKSLCGCGVGFKLLQGIAGRLGKADLPNKYLDFVALASTADIVPMIGENRTLVRLGMDIINSQPRPGIRALIEISGLHPGLISTGQVVFVLAPRINAVGRLGSAERAVELLTCDDYAASLDLARVMEEENRNRRKIDEETFTKAQEIVEKYFDVENDSVIVLHQDTWHPGVIGIVASRLVEKYYRPTVMMTTVDGVAKGSARSVAGFDIYTALKRVEDKLLQFGGHKYAAGLSIDIDRVDEFRTAFNLVVKELLSDNLKVPEIKIDCEISLSTITSKFIKILKQCVPFGPGNMRPVFLAKNVEVIGSPRIVGKDHLRFKVRDGQIVFDAIGFGLGRLVSRIEPGRKNLDIVFSIDENEWNGGNNGNGKSYDRYPQLKIKDLK